VSIQARLGQRSGQVGPLTVNGRVHYAQVLTGKTPKQGNSIWDDNVKAVVDQSKRINTTPIKSIAKQTSAAGSGAMSGKKKDKNRPGISGKSTGCAETVAR
jgi:hypothetical protein